MAATMVTDPLADLWNHTMSTDRTDLMCFYPSKITMGGIWVGDNPLDFSMPLLLFQVLLITSTTRAATLLLSPLRLPRYISEILAGFLLGPSVLGRLPHFSDLVFPIRSLFVLESLALFGLVYYTFIVGVEIEVPTITNAGLRSFGFAAGHTEMQFKHISHALVAYAENAEGVSARTMAAVSPYVSMHEDITSAAENLHSALILLPFHKHRSVDGGMGVSHPAIQPLNGSVQRFSPCTVGILVDRGLAAVPGAGYRVVALFFGGSDDREVAALATRMAKNPAIDLTVLRFVQKGGSFTASEFDALKERKADDGCLREFLDRANEGGGATVEYRERGVFNANEMVAEIQSVEAMGNKDLFVVGKVPGGSGLTAGMAEWSECPELGPIGDLLASKDFQTTASVLVLQAYGRPAVVGAVSVDLGGESVAPTERSASGRGPWARSAP
uniref:Uncharacterized protein n=1 Tax=Oryza brachyantha TaxID=4533 RepID=J3N5M6_ORYBR